MTALVQQALHAGVLEVVLTDPPRRNALSPAMRDELIEVLACAASAEQVSVVVLAGAAGTFSAGGDLGSMPPASPEASDERMRRVELLIRTVLDLSKPTVVALEGAAAGASVGLAAACDLVVMAEDARVVLPFGALGLVPDGGVMASLSLRVGGARARRILLLGEPVSASEAQLWGLADVVVPAGQVRDVALERARLLASRAPGTLRAVKAAFRDGAPGFDDAFEAERLGQRELFFSADFAEGKRAFFDKRAPVFGALAPAPTPVPAAEPPGPT